MNDERSFGHWLSHRRKVLHLTQGELARRIGCATVTVQKIEADQRRPSKDMAGWSVTARAADGEPLTAEAREARALELFDKSEEAYQKGRFQDAVNLLREAYELKKEPVLLYNLARAYEGFGALDLAAKAYEDYLAGQPDTKDRGAIEQRIATLRRQIAEREASKKRAAQPAPRPERKPSAVPWIVAGFGVVGLGTGTAFALLASGKHKDAENEPVQITSSHDQDVAKTDATVAAVAFVAGGALAATGLVWAVLDVRASGERAARVRIAPSIGGLRVVGSFD